MNSDTQRNLFFSRAIQSVDARTWLEIGCGAEALLSSMVLSRNDTRVFALEVNQESARRASRALASQPLFAGRFEVRNLHSRDLPREKAARSPEAVLFELFGPVASSEGVVETMNFIRKQLSTPNNVTFIPQCASTCIVPVTLDVQTLSSAWRDVDELYVSPKMLLARRFDFATNSLTGTDVALLERLDFQASRIKTKQEHETTLPVSQTGVLRGFAAYITLIAPAPSRKRPRQRWPSCQYEEIPENFLWTSSNASDNSYSRNWRNPIFLLSKPTRVEAGSRLRILATAFLADRRPSYHVHCSVLTKRGAVVDLEEVRISFDDFYPTFTELVPLPARSPSATPRRR
uniref:Methyltransferase domain-containing protein n=1 Tax=Chromera velia CCMP2878 TaxID=1169474 RepID=A0A0G4FBC3_9ALVE|eukprot:Cvel_16131.t1-p1 / transcript=Cvel_16131.t1 / gene=Cvel_16131 / organism=Chromera_velia_CCMP2878 / gene_product=hypothetical protein / transcript_product=hypothetical protein / location=Cvel_scaffold1227:42281-43315(-) / protein_length=345 / sequence_SO=supercontig / SO=protein_coding / is_pseudo=false